MIEYACVQRGSKGGQKEVKKGCFGGQKEVINDPLLDH